MPVKIYAHVMKFKLWLYGCETQYPNPTHSNCKLLNNYCYTMQFIKHLEISHAFKGPYIHCLKYTTLGYTTREDHFVFIDAKQTPNIACDQQIMVNLQ